MITEHNIWNECLDKLSETLTEKEIRLWIAPLKVKKDGDALKLYAPNKFMKEEVEKNFLDKIADVLNQLTGNALISLDVSSPVKTTEKVRAVPSGFVSNLNSDMTFESFVEGKSNQLAKAACLSVVNEPGAFDPLYIYGGVGLGKTHLLHSIGNKLSNENKKVVMGVIYGVCRVVSSRYPAYPSGGSFRIGAMCVIVCIGSQSIWRVPEAVILVTLVRTRFSQHVGASSINYTLVNVLDHCWIKLNSFLHL